MSRLVLPSNLRRLAAFLAVTIHLAVQPAGHPHAQALTPPNPLPEPHGYLVTGNYAVGSVDFPAQAARGILTDRIHVATCPDPQTDPPTVNCVPANATINAAYLYWEMIDVNPQATITFQDQPVVDPLVTSVLKRSDQPLTGASCYSSGQPLILTMFRADVRRLLPLQYDANKQPTGKRLVGDGDLVANGYPAGLKIQTVEGGTGNVLPQVAGASLFVVYSTPTDPLRKIMVYENPPTPATSPGQVYIQPSLDTVTTQTFRGIYKSAADTSALLTQIVGSGQKNSRERIFFRGNPGASAAVLANTGDDPFKEAKTASDRAWSSPTYNVSTLMTPGIYSADGFGETPTTTIDHSRGGAYDCLAWAAMILSTVQADADGDGVADGAEDGNAAYDADGSSLPPLGAWGANSLHKDILLEIDAMSAPAGTSYGATTAPYSLVTSSAPAVATDANGHDHMPPPGAVKILIDAYRGAPVPITPHIDVGGDPRRAAYISAINAIDPLSGVDYSQYFIPSADAKGGDLIPEQPCGLDSPPCQFQAYPGTLNFDHGLPAISRRYFDRNRADFFHYFASVHAVAKAKSPYPCLDNSTTPPTPKNYDGSTGAPMLFNPTAICPSPLTDNPAFRVPKSVSGRAQHPGAKGLVALGLWQKVTPAGAVVEQASPEAYGSTFLHELGHNGNLWHGGAAPTWNPTTRLVSVEPNCKPVYVSIMSYLFQMTGQKDNEGNRHFDYSRDDPRFGVPAHTIDEGHLNDVAFNPELPYRTAWFAPPTFLGATEAKRFCSGAPFDPKNRPAPMARFDGPATSVAIDWNANGTLDWGSSLPPGSQDVNFDGPGGPAELKGYSDWSNLRLDQIGSGIAPAGYSDGASAEDSGASAEDSGASAEDSGASAEDSGASAEDSGRDMDLDAFAAVGHASPTKIKACVVATPGCISASPSTPDNHRNYIEWKAPDGHVISYTVYRSTGTTFNPASFVTVGTVSSTPTSLPATNTVDHEELPDGVPFTYVVKANFDDGGSSPASDPPATIPAAVNVAPVAFDDNFTTDKTLVVSAPGVLGNDTDTDTSPFTAGNALGAKLRAVLVAGTGPTPAQGTLTLTLGPDGLWNGGFRLVPAPAFSGTITFRYVANDGKWSRDSNVSMSSNSNEATVTIQVKPRKK